MPDTSPTPEASNSGESPTDLSSTVDALRAELAHVQARLAEVEERSNPAPDRRRFPRVPVSVNAYLLTDRRPGSPIEGKVVDLSEGGFGLIVDTLIVLDTYLFLSSTSNPDGPRVQARVASRTPMGSCWRLGCEFTRPVTTNELGIFADGLIDEPSTSPT